MELVIQELPEEEALQEWKERNTFTSPRTQLNTIRLVNKDTIWVEEVDEASGNVSQKKAINPDYGKLLATTYIDGVEFTEEVDIKKAHFYLAKSRQSVSFKDIQQSNKYIIPEAEPFHNIYILDKETKDQVVAGRYKDLKEEWDLKYAEAAYVYYNDKMYRWKITSAHFESWFEIRQALQEADHPMTFQIKSITENTSSGVAYNVMAFKLGDKIPVSLAVSVDRAVDEFFAERARKYSEDEVKQIEQTVNDKPY